MGKETLNLLPITAGDCLTTCRQPNYICKDKTCVCNIGFSTTTDGKCVKGCSSYKDSFTVQQEGLCMWKYQEKYAGRNSAWCHKKCIMSDFECGSFEMYDDTCHISKWKLKYFQHEIWQPYTGCKHYTRNCNHKGSHCDVCDGPQYQCRDNKCVCSRGYSFVVGVGTCVGECVSYAHSFTKQSTHHCFRKYKRKYPKTTAKTCEHKCRHEKKFTCGAFHIYKGNCYTMEWDMTSLEKTWERKQKGCEQYMRDCKPNCEMGYSLIPDKNRCVRDCKVYSTKFQKQSNFICDTKYDKKLKNVDRRGCERACLKSKKMCDGYELHKNNCYIIPENKGHGAEWKVYDKGCTHHQRICKE
ncbi:uncharacterized protein LOC125372046 [Haliotis rufescens]|uniref:uncharacterized protein LOC125372046 n=1 Tax=Haliotis rufescens TaxID=6454 RepID=UPI00201EFB2E|nr:uncharacterized protein LOC125372046 [Haliotis rufescens]